MTLLIKETINSISLAKMAKRPHSTVVSDIRKLLIDLCIEPSRYYRETGNGAEIFIIEGNIATTLLASYDPAFAFALINELGAQQ